MNDTTTQRLTPKQRLALAVLAEAADQGSAGILTGRTTDHTSVSTATALSLQRIGLAAVHKTGAYGRFTVAAITAAGGAAHTKDNQ